MKQTCTINDPPLLTFAVLAYNQERFIRDAIESAFSQTYSPLEIILTDDCSTDGTFTTIQEIVSSYKGPHRIILNRNPRNLGLGGQINRIMELSTGELVVIAAGDDISLPERTSLIYEAWEYSGRAVTSIYSGYSVIDKSGAPYLSSGDPAKEKSGPLYEIQRGDLVEFMTTCRPMVYGCTHAWSRRLFSHFGPLRADLRTEDLTLCFRSLAIEGILHINRPLVKYRRHAGNLSCHPADSALDQKLPDEYDAKRRAILQMNVISYDAIIDDIEALRRMNKHNFVYLDQVEQEARRVRELYVLERQMMSEKFLTRVRTLLRIVSQGGLQLAFNLAPQVFPRWLYHNLRATKWMVLSYLKKNRITPC